MSKLLKKRKSPIINLEKLIGNVGKYKGKIGIGLIIIGLMGLFVFLFLRYFKETNIKAADLFNKAQHHFYKREYEKATPLYDDIINQYRYSRIANLALFFKGNALFEQKKYKEAREVYKIVRELA